MSDGEPQLYAIKCPTKTKEVFAYTFVGQVSWTHFTFLHMMLSSVKFTLYRSRFHGIHTGSLNRQGGSLSSLGEGAAAISNREVKEQLLKVSAFFIPQHFDFLAWKNKMLSHSTCSTCKRKLNSYCGVHSLRYIGTSGAPWHIASGQVAATFCSIYLLQLLADSYWSPLSAGAPSHHWGVGAVPCAPPPSPVDLPSLLVFNVQC